MHIAIEHTQWRGYHPRLHVIVHAHRCTINRLGVELGVAPAGQSDLCELFRGGAIVMKMPLRIHGHQICRREHIEWGVPLPGKTAVPSLSFIRQG